MNGKTYLNFFNLKNFFLIKNNNLNINSLFNNIFNRSFSQIDNKISNKDYKSSKFNNLIFHKNPIFFKNSNYILHKISSGK